MAVERAAHRSPLLPAVRRVRRGRCAVLHPGRSHRPAAAVGDRTPDSLHRPGRPGLSRAGDRVRTRWLSVDRRDGRRGAQTRERLHRYVGLHHQAAARRARPIHENRYRTTQSLVRHQLPDDRPPARAGRARRSRPRRRGSPRLPARQRRTRVQTRRRSSERCSGSDQHLGRRRASTCASPTPGHRRCTSWPRWTPCHKCAAC